MATDQIIFTDPNGTVYDLTLTVAASSPLGDGTDDGTGTITSITGTVGTDTITMLGDDPSTDNAITSLTYPQIDENGISFDTGSDVFVVSNDGAGDIDIYDYDGNVSGQVADYSFTVEQATACYVRGTRIRAAHGEVAIEDLVQGDRLVTDTGALRPVKWLGYRTLDCTRHPVPSTAWPIRISQGAFAPGQPARDLWVSPAHAIAVEGVLIAAILLVNGITIVQEKRPSVEYWHVELDTHDVIIAEGLAAESYLDTGNRGAFENCGGAVDLHPDFAPRNTEKFCRKLVSQGPQITRARAALWARAEALGLELTDDPAPHVVSDDAIIAPIPLGGGRMAFVLPEGSRARLVSRSFLPAALAQGGADRRILGISIDQVQIDGQPLALADDALFGEGWHAHEPSATGQGWRWTDGDAALPRGARLVVINMSGRGTYPMLRAAAVRQALSS